MFELLLTGLYLGSIHILTAPDHLAALVPLSLMDRKRSWRIGLLWGLGHLSGLLVLGTILFFFKSLIPLESLQHFSMLYIGILLIFIGIWIYYRSKKINFEVSAIQQNRLHKITLGTGFIHGIAGFSHIYTLAPSLSMDNQDFISYFSGFALGGIVSVVLLTYLLCFLPASITSRQSLYQKICRISAVIAVFMGIVLLVLFLSGESLHSH